MAIPARHYRKTIWWEKYFDPKADFEVQRPFRYEGETTVPGTPFPTDNLSTRFLRMLHSTGLILQLPTEAERIQWFNEYLESTYDMVV